MTGKSILSRYGFTIVALTLFAVALAGQWLFGWYEYAAEQQAHEQALVFSEYFMQLMRGTLENWQSEFLQLVWQMAGLSFLLPRRAIFRKPVIGVHRAVRRGAAHGSSRHARRPAGAVRHRPAGSAAAPGGCDHSGSDSGWPFDWFLFSFTPAARGRLQKGNAPSRAGVPASAEPRNGNTR